jgi:hypothetical protein
MDRERCCICEELFFMGETLQLTDEEMAMIGPTAKRTIHSCSGCLKAIRNVQQGANIVSGLFERELRAAGVPGADERAAKFKQNLLQAATRKLQ